MDKSNLLFIVSGPSGVGKDTVIVELLKKCPDMKFSISTITRPMRPGEVDGEKYHFVSREEFDKLLSEGGFLEHAEYCGNCYGTPKKNVDDWLNNNEKVLIEVDVQGAISIQKHYPNAKYIFIMPSSIKELKSRLLERATDSEEIILKRVNEAEREIRNASIYNYILFNRTGKLDNTVDEFCDIINGNRKEDSLETRNKYIEEVLLNA